MIQSLEILVAILGYQSLIISLFLLISDRGKALPNRLLGLFFLLVFIEIVAEFLLSSIWPPLKYLAYVGILYGPLIQMYFQSLSNPTATLSQILKINVLPVVALVILTTSISFKSIEYEIILALAFLIYLIITQASLYRLIQRIKYGFSNLEFLEIRWLYYFLVPLSIIVLSDILEVVFFLSENIFMTHLFLVLHVVFFLVTECYVLFYGTKRSNLYMGIVEKIKPDSIGPRYKNTNIDHEELTKLAEDFDSRIRSKKLFLNPDLNLALLSKTLEVNPRELSQVINQKFGTNFSDYINYLRLKYAQRLLENTPNDEMNISQIMYQSGFNSKTAFYNYFRKQTGISPKEYRRRSK